MNDTWDRVRGTDIYCVAASASTWLVELRMANPLRKLVQQIREEFENLPDLHLTVNEASRFWALDLATCQQVLVELLASGSVALDGDRRYHLAQS